MENYLSFTAVLNSPEESRGTVFVDKSIVAFKLQGTYETESLPNLEFSYNQLFWYTVDLENDEIEIPIEGTVYFRGENTSFSTKELTISFENKKGLIEVGGNIMSLLDKTVKSTTIPSSYCFRNLFKGMGIRTTFGDISLPAVILKDYCYEGMFWGTNIKKIPTLPAGITEEREGQTIPTIHWSMEGDWTYTIQENELILVKQTRNPEKETEEVLVAEDLEHLVYSGVKEGCYKNMFRDCKRLNGTAEATFTHLPCRNLRPHCYEGMFRGCVFLETPLDLKSTYDSMLSEYCCAGMYQDCSRLSRVAEVYNAIVTFPHCCTDMYNGCTSLTGNVTINFTQSAIKCYRLHYKEVDSTKTSDDLMHYYFPCEADGDILYDTTYDSWKSSYETCKGNPQKYKLVGIEFRDDYVIIDGPNHIAWNDCMFRNCGNLSKVTLISTNIQHTYPWLTGSTRLAGGKFSATGITEDTADAFAWKVGIPMGQGRTETESNWTFEPLTEVKAAKKSRSKKSKKKE